MAQVVWLSQVAYAVCLFLLISGCSGSGPGPGDKAAVSELVLTEQDSNKSIDVHVGNPVSIRLPENPATGYRWNISQVDESIVSVESSEFIQTPGGGVGGGGVRTIKLLPRTPGVTQLSLKNKRPWEGDASAVGQFEITLNISQ